MENYLSALSCGLSGAYLEQAAYDGSSNESNFGLAMPVSWPTTVDLRERCGRGARIELHTSLVYLHGVSSVLFRKSCKIKHDVSQTSFTLPTAHIFFSLRRSRNNSSRSRPLASSSMGMKSGAKL